MKSHDRGGEVIGLLDSEDEIRMALRLVLEQPAPPMTTSLDEVLASGRRQVRAERMSAALGVLGVVMVVGAVAFGASTLRQGGPGGQLAAAGVSSSTSPITTTVDGLAGWQRVTVAGKPMRTVSASPGVSTRTSAPPQYCQGAGQLGQPTPTGTILPQTTVEPAFRTALTTVTGDASIVLYQASWSAHDAKIGGPRGYVWFDLDKADGQTSVELEVDRYGGTAGEAADADAYRYASCTPPLREVLPDGVVLQLYPPQPYRPFVQYLGIYGPNGHHYTVDDMSWGSSDQVPVSGAPGVSTVGPGRATVALTDRQLAALGERLAQLG